MGQRSGGKNLRRGLNIKGNASKREAGDGRPVSSFILKAGAQVLCVHLDPGSFTLGYIPLLVPKPPRINPSRNNNLWAKEWKAHANGDVIRTYISTGEGCTFKGRMFWRQDSF